LEAWKRRDKLALVSSESRSEPLTIGPAGERSERLFLPRGGSVSKLALGLGMLGCAASGAGVYGAWLAPHAPSAAWPLLLGGIAVAAVASFVGPKAALPVRVGELGVIVGDPAEARRMHWYEIDAVRIAGEELRLESKEESLELPLGAHARAAARIVAEASQRIPGRVDISPKAYGRLPRLNSQEGSAFDGERVPAARLQLAGQRCLASGTSITFESDARLCPNCGAIYHSSHVPAACLRCERPLAQAAPSPATARAAS
jgi:hypothetical protein